MGPQKTTITFNFAQGLELKEDPKQIPAGKFLSLQNMVRNKGGLLQKRNGFGQLTALPVSTNATHLTTFNDNLTAISNTISAFNPSNNNWINKGNLQPLSLNTLPLIRSNTNQSQADIAISTSGLICTVYTDQDPSNLTTPLYKYVVANATTGQNIIAPTIIPAVGGGTITGSPRVYFYGSHFVILFTNHISSQYHLQFIAISTTNISIVTAPVDVTSTYDFTTRLSYDAIVCGTRLFIAFSSASGGQAVKLCYIDNSLNVSSFVTFATYKATIMGVGTDGTNIVAAFYDVNTTTGYSLVIDQALTILRMPVQIISSGTVLNITPILQNDIATTYYEVDHNYGYDSALPTHYVSRVSVPTSTGITTSPTKVIKDLGLASKAFIVDNTQYFLGAHQTALQPTYFLVNATLSADITPIISAKLAYQNGGGYLNTGLPNATVNGMQVSMPYLFKDLVTSVNKNTNVPTGTQVDGIYSQTGINYVTFDIGDLNFDTVEIGSSLQLTGGYHQMYDGYLPVEENFFVYPEDVEATPNNTGGAMLAQKYFYQVVYEWTDNQGLAHRGAPSIPVMVDMSTANLAFTPPTPITWTGAGAAGQNFIDSSSIAGLQIGQIVEDQTNPSYIQANSSIILIEPTIPAIEISLPIATDISSDTLATSTICSVTLNIPTLRLTAKTSNPVKIVIYRWSVAQQEYFQVTSISQPVLNDLSVDYITYTDTQADSQILGNALIYTTGGVVEDVNAPASTIMTLWQTRLFLVDSEDQNLIWFSKSVIENTPVEMSDLFTVYVAPTIGASGSTGPITALGAMDDKLIIFKKDAIYYISGTGPDNTGANNLFSDPIFITSVVGCTNQQSIVNTPMGLIFQSDKGIWILDRSLSTNYIGSPVDTIALSASVLSSVLVPGTNQIRFTLDNDQTLMYDYFYSQWSTFNGIPGISSCIQNNLHTYLDSIGRVFQETPGKYTDGDTPVLMHFTTGWLNLAGIAAYQRIYEFALTGDYLSPHLLELQVAYDFGYPTQQSTINPTNFTGVYGSDSLYGQTTPYGGPPTLEQWRVHTERQKCQTFQITLNEVYDPQYGTAPGAGFTLSAITCEVGVKRGTRPYKGAASVG